MIIQHNMAAMNANRQIQKNNRARATAMERLSGGYRINRATDDAAGLSISETMRSQIRGLNRASDNLQDGISYVQVADGALQEVNEMLHRIHELSVQAASDTNVAEDRLAIDNEIQELKKEINKIFAETEFNTKKIWHTADVTTQVQVGTVQEPAVKFLSNNTKTILTNTNKEAIPKNSYALSANDDGITVSWTGYNGQNYTSNIIPWDSNLTGLQHFELKDHLDLTAHPELSGINFKYSYNVNENASLTDVINAINGKRINSYVSTSEQANNYIAPGAANRASFSTYIDYDALLVSEKNFEAEDTAFLEGINSYDNITVNPATGNSSDTWEFTFQMKNIGEVKADFKSIHYSSPNRDADKEGLWWDWYTFPDGRKTKSGNSLSNATYTGSLDDVVNILDNSNGNSLLHDTNGSGGSISLFFTLTSTTPYTTKSGSSTTSVGTFYMTVSVYGTDTVDSIKQALKGLTGVDIKAPATNSTSTASNYSSQSSVKVDCPIYDIQVNGVCEVNIQCGANSNQMLKLEYLPLTNTVIGIHDSNCLTRENASQTIDQVQRASEIISAERSRFGAYQNRMEHAMTNANNTAENLQTAESKIRDANMAEETVKQAKYNILMEASQSMLSMSNQSPKNIMSLLR